MTAITLHPTLKHRFSAMLAATKMRLITISRYKGDLIMDIIIPVVLAAMPVLLGRAMGGSNAALTFEARTGTQNYAGYMIIGSSAFTIVSYAFWHVAYWLRYEMETGTIESVYMTPTDRVWILGGVSLYSMMRGLFSSFTAYFIGSLIFGSNPLQGELLMAFLFIVMGMIPLYGMTLLYGALILKVKEANALINLMQWGVNFIMGVFFPITVLPPLARVLSYLFPPTWMTNGVRSALLGVGYFFGEWYLDLAVLWAFMIIAPMFGMWVFRKVETNVRLKEGVSKF